MVRPKVYSCLPPFFASLHPYKIWEDDFEAIKEL